MATRDTIQELEDIVARDRRGNINARFARRRICFRQQLNEFF